MEYEERESEFDIEDEDKSEPEQIGNSSYKREITHAPCDVDQTQGVCVCQVEMLLKMKRWTSPQSIPSQLSAAGW